MVVAGSQWGSGAGSADAATCDSVGGGAKHGLLFDDAVIYSFT